MKLCIVGAGAIGGLIAAYFARAGHDVSVVARGEHLAAIKAKGLTLRHRGGQSVQRCAAADDPAAFGAQDCVFIALKAPAIGAMLPRLKPLLGADTAVVPAINGVPWWYFHRAGGESDGSAVDCLDPGGAMLRALDPARILGCVVFPGANIPEPGIVEQTTPDARFTLGEPDGSRSRRAQALAAAMTAAGMATEVTDRIRDAVWSKLLGNVSFNPIAALARARMGEIFAQPPLLALATQLIREAMAVGAAYGVAFQQTVEQRLEVAGRLGNSRPSMLQDVERGRPMEVEAIVGAVVELGRRAGVPTPTVSTIYALLAGRDAALRANGR